PILATMWMTLSRWRWRCVALSWRFSALLLLMGIRRHGPSSWTGCSASWDGRIFRWPWAYRLTRPTSLRSEDMLRVDTLRGLRIPGLWISLRSRYAAIRGRLL